MSGKNESEHRLLIADKITEAISGFIDQESMNDEEKSESQRAIEDMVDDILNSMGIVFTGEIVGNQAFSATIKLRDVPSYLISIS